MLGTVKNWFFRRILNRHRLLFRFWNGSRFVSEDPFVLFRRLLNTQAFDPDVDLKLLEIKTDPKLVVRKMEHIAEGVREIFEIPAFDAGGLTELECIQLLLQFSGWMETVKKNGVTNQTLSTSSPVSGTAIGSPDQNDMNVNSDYFSTASA